MEKNKKGSGETRKIEKRVISRDERGAEERRGARKGEKRVENSRREAGK